MLFSPRLISDINYYDQCYNKKLHLIFLPQMPWQNPHSPYRAAMAHHLLESLEYALLLAEQKPSEKKRINDLVSAVLSMQDINPQSDMYGHFPYYYEESLKKFITPDIVVSIRTATIAFQLLKYDYLFSDEMLERIKSACLATAFITPFGIENIPACAFGSFIASYFLIGCGKSFQKSEFLNHGILLLNRAAAGISYNYNFWEYGSKYAFIIISEILSHFKKMNLGSEYTSVINELYDRLWNNTAMQYHAPTGCIPTPQTNKSAYFSDTIFMNFLQSATGLKLHENNKYHAQFVSKCPQKYLQYFYDPAPNRFNMSIVWLGTAYPNFTLSKAVSLYVQPLYSLSSFSHEEFGHLQIPLIGCFGTKDSPYTFRMLVLNNDHEFGSAQLHCLQSHGTIIGHVVISTNRGDDHPTFDPTYGKISSYDFRIRLEICGDVSKLKTAKQKNVFKVTCSSVSLTFKIPYINIAGLPTAFKLTKTKHRLCLDVIVSPDKPFEINLKEIESAICQFVLHMTATGRPLEKVSNSFKDGFMITKTNIRNYNLELKTPVKPDYFEYLMTNDAQLVNGLPFTKYVESLQSKSLQYQYVVSANTSIELPALDQKSENRLEDIKTAPIPQLPDWILEITNSLIEKNYTIDIFKRHAVQIVMMLYSRMTSENFRFEKIIDNNYMDIYQKINIEISAREIQKIIIKVTKKLVSTYNTLSSQLSIKSIVNTVITIINDNYQNPDLSLKMIAEMTGTTETYISHVFKDNLGTNYKQYLTHVRIEKAKKMLIQGCDMDEILKACGYIYSTSFRRLFRQYTGMTISEWMRQQ